MSSGEITLALIGGTGLTEWEDNAETLVVDTPYGAPSATLRILVDGPVRLVFLPRHGNPHRFPPHKVNYRANLWALRAAGATHILSVYAVGGIGPGYVPGTLVAPDQLIDYTWGREHTFSDSADTELVHIDFTRPFDGVVRSRLLAVAAIERETMVDGGCIGVFQGPRLETAAEIQRARRDGCHMAGMTALPEASLARELGVDYAGLAVVSNYGAGMTSQLLSEEGIAATLCEPMQRVRRLVPALAQSLADGLAQQGGKA